MTDVPTFDWSSFGCSDVGTVRSVNEDAYLTLPEQCLWAVADGMGGHAAGDVASQAIVESLAAIQWSDNIEIAIERALEGLEQVNHKLRTQARAQQVQLIGSTIVLLIARQNRLSCLWAGDSRAYRLRYDHLEQLTLDHSRVQEMVSSGLLTPEQAASHPDAHLITRALGVTDQIDPERLDTDLQINDQLLLCSDGLSNVLSDTEIARLLSTNDCQQGAKALVKLAVDKGARDNVTAVVIKAFEDVKTQIATMVDDEQTVIAVPGPKDA